MSRIPPLRPKQVRTQQDPVSGELVHTILTPVQTRFEMCCHHIDGRMLELSRVEGAELAAKLIEWLGHYTKIGSRA